MADQASEIEELTRRVDELERFVPNPFENLEFQLALENGNTVSARTRYHWLNPNNFGIETGTPTLISVGAWSVGLRVWSFPGTDVSGITTALAVPADWVGGTVKFTVFYQGAGSNTDTRRLNLHTAALTVGTDSFTRAIETSDGVTVVHGNGSVTTHTFATGETVAAGDLVRLAFSRDAAHGDDTNTDAVYVVGLRAEYTAFF